MAPPAGEARDSLRLALVWVLGGNLGLMDRSTQLHWGDSREAGDAALGGRGSGETSLSPELFTRSGRSCGHSREEGELQRPLNTWLMSAAEWGRPLCASIPVGAGKELIQCHPQKGARLCKFLRPCLPLSPSPFYSAGFEVASRRVSSHSRRQE